MYLESSWNVIGALKKIGGAYAWDAITVTPLTTDLVNCKYLPSTMYGKDVNYFLRNNRCDNCYISNAMNGLDFKTQKKWENCVDKHVQRHAGSPLFSNFNIANVLYGNACDISHVKLSHWNPPWLILVIFCRLSSPMANFYPPFLSIFRRVFW